jgi:hypothetical protein
MRGKECEKVRGCGLLGMAVAAALWFGTGCEQDGGGDSDNSAFVGTWLVTKYDDSPSSSYYVFNQDGTFYKTRSGEPPNGNVHLRGVYGVDGGTLKGSFTNPGVGSGEIVATIKNGTMEIDFIEHWHTPYKHVRCVGVKQ